MDDFDEPQCEEFYSAWSDPDFMEPEEYHALNHWQLFHRLGLDTPQVSPVVCEHEHAASSPAADPLTR